MSVTEAPHGARPLAAALARLASAEQRRADLLTYDGEAYTSAQLAFAAQIIAADLARARNAITALRGEHRAFRRLTTWGRGRGARQCP